jgi:hypothetical protein
MALSRRETMVPGAQRKGGQSRLAPAGQGSRPERGEGELTWVEAPHLDPSPDRR